MGSLIAYGMLAYLLLAFWGTSRLVQGVIVSVASALAFIISVTYLPGILVVCSGCRPA